MQSFSPTQSNHWALNG